MDLGKSREINMAQRHAYNEDKEYSTEPDECDHEDTDTVIDSIGEVAGQHISFEECNQCGAKL